MTRPASIEDGAAPAGQEPIAAMPADHDNCAGLGSFVADVEEQIGPENGVLCPRFEKAS